MENCVLQKFPPINSRKNIFLSQEFTRSGFFFLIIKERVTHLTQAKNSFSFFFALPEKKQ